MGSSALIKKLKDFDGYPKTLDDYRIRTLGGGAVTVFSYIIMFLLFVSELSTFLTPDVIEELFVDTTREPKLQINLNFTVPAISCKYLSLDAMDSSGEQHLQIDHNIYKRSLDINGNPINEPEKEELIKRNTNSTDVSSQKKCGSCYGAESKELNITCCNTCAEVRSAYALQKWSFNPEAVEQCKNFNNENIFTEGCNIYGSMEVNRVGGSFHIAPGHSYSINHVHVHDVQPFPSTAFNTSHIVEHLSFGVNIPGKTNPLDGTVGLCTEGTTMFQYYIKIVPTLYYYDQTGGMILTNQFSVTRHQKSDVGLGGMPPGIFVNYELAPIMVKYTEKKRSIGHFLTNICAIIGGVFTVASLIDGLLYHSVKVIQEKIDLGKKF
ncbi:UNVERIFIED_CONTAM: hypothetical protein PYX00_006870 [Menopon gallinae]|uniref:Endoplasmic reticulum-Golgi intermediate compartment protein 3 n=1 Tax=Menopon gallinae TaxID=328185 RepID=A0AAW2HYM7_9NEOP